MNKELTRRQQVERDYHNRKYGRNDAPASSTVAVSAYDFYQRKIDNFEIGKILDFGCGDGWVSIKLAQRGHEVFGIDISIELVKKARNWASELGISHKAHFDEMAGENLSFPDNFFDKVVGSAILHHTELELALNNIRNVLKPDGKGLFIEPMNQNMLLKIWRILTPWRRSPTERALTIREIDIIKKIFPAAKLHFFILSSIVTIGLLTIFPRVHFLKKTNNVLEGLDNFLIRRFPKLGNSCAVVVIELIKDEEMI